MAGFVELTTEDGARALFNVELIVMVAPAGDDPAMGTRLTFPFATGPDRKNWRVRVMEDYARVLEAVKKASEAPAPAA